jgi:hypothetical protein
MWNFRGMILTGENRVQVTLVLRQGYIPEILAQIGIARLETKVAFKTMDLRGLVDGQLHLFSA